MVHFMTCPGQAGVVATLCKSYINTGECYWRTYNKRSVMKSNRHFEPITSSYFDNRAPLMQESAANVSYSNTDINIAIQ